MVLLHYQFTLSYFSDLFKFLHLATESFLYILGHEVQFFSIYSDLWSVFSVYVFSRYICRRWNRWVPSNSYFRDIRQNEIKMKEFSI